MKYILIQFPEIQEYMELEWFESEAILMNDEKHFEDFGPSAYFIPFDRYNNDEGKLAKTD